MICYLGLGSNLGDRKDYINRAISRISSHPEISMLKCSTIIETQAFGKKDQPDFLNCVMKIKTQLNPSELLKFCLKTEKSLGRIRYETWGTRTIDIDLLLYENRIVEQPNLKIPHPGIPKREFVLRSLVELCPDYIHPVSKKRIKEMYSEIY
ncbi:MAG: 2-amino-4-hydroxy-6-hydroxymethyldihydropteridine diphosphokinase [Candidatus Cloacimonetes bacterium]|nr:2-amino-4-hydroxy-6-hydroxymethyldihydropteridine diphosphokinase [Candidatus Cloacimonadota bacterium]MCF7813565.1 2-amino-4-hydroxy-6-hydroxymethyldihydropteridine diphosphokinase [Candidatus Cloacimonadota bacterium]MCF7868196.1 2-amino-4-hydroxy-6-hydroxymethyldihydropteridine diphosphokinase [Candidatus Cloacimonadota bacterium]MCF7883640.1 2-amino-4-hydroxy-6-hydroxymethyldihydropteridine diphosphokinase [Candidatus Cloacimonadota bacterium]